MKIMPLLKKILLYSGLGILLLLVIFSVAYKIFITPAFVSGKVNGILKRSFPVPVSFRIRSISLLSGIEIEHVKVYNPPSYRRDLFLSIDKVKIKYNFLSFLLLKIKFDEIVIQDPYVFLEYSPRLGKWNFASFTGAPKKKEQEKKTGPLSVDFDLKKFNINNLQVELYKDLYLLVKGLNLALNLNLDRTSLEGVKKVNLRFYNTGKENIILRRSGMNLIMPFHLDILLNIPDRKEGRIRLSYVLEKQLVEINNKFIRLPDLRFKLDSRIFLNQYSLSIEELLFLVNKNPVLNLKGRIIRFNKEARVQIVSAGNHVDLNDFEDLIRTLLNRERLKISGQFRTDELVIRNDQASGPVRMASEFNLRDLNFTLPENKINIQGLGLNFLFKNDEKNKVRASVRMRAAIIQFDLVQVSNFNFQIQAGLDNLMKLRSVRAWTRDCRINHGNFNTDLRYSDGLLIGNIELKGLDIGQFNRMVSGHLDLVHSIRSGNKDVIRNRTTVTIPDFQVNTFFSNRKFPSKTIPLSFESDLSFFPSGMRIDIPALEFKAGNILESILAVQKKETIEAEIKHLCLRLENIIPALPENLLYSIPFTRLKGSLFLNGSFLMEKEHMKAHLFLTNDPITLEKDNSGLVIQAVSSEMKWEKEMSNQHIVCSLSLSNIENKYRSFNTNINDYNISYSNIAGKVGLFSRARLAPGGLVLEDLDVQVPDLHFRLSAKGSMAGKPVPLMDFKALMSF
ncbi:MAG: hypothetical protein PHF84_05980, partial [bacterium]|nr:hypothetical protein [bacterium]